jgi:hypothetical protein
MSNKDDTNDAFGGANLIFWIMIIGIFLYLMVFVVGFIIIASATFGGGVSLYNYGLAFKNQVKLEKPTI